MEDSKTISHYPFPETIALVVCGGKSSRMGADKSLLRYYEKLQRYHVYEMLSAFCNEVYISCNAMQTDTIGDAYHFITDDKKYADIGPMAALLTAADQFPEKNILFIGCDYPFLKANDLKLFSEKCGHSKPVSFYNESSDLFEPLLAWYPHLLFSKLTNRHKRNQHSLQHFLQENNSVKFYPADKSCIISVDTKEAYAETLNSLKR